MTDLTTPNTLARTSASVNRQQFVADTVKVAAGHWPFILETLGISTSRKETQCPHCGGNTRYRFDDLENRGTYHCSHCGAGDGLDLVMKVKQCSAVEAAGLVADTLSLNTLPEKTVPDKKLPEPDFSRVQKRLTTMLSRTIRGISPYLADKGLDCPDMPLLDDGSLLVVLKNIEGEITGAQVIRPTGEKKLLIGSRKKGAFASTGELPAQPETLLIAEGYATAITVLLLHKGTTLAAMDAGNLLPVAVACRERWPEVKIIIAADNDIKSGEKNHSSERNTGKEAAEKAAAAVSGWVALPPTDTPADWDDYRQQNGTQAATLAFTDSLYQPKRKKIQRLPAAAGNDKSRPYADIRHGGLYWVEPKTDRDTGEVIERESWLCDPLVVVGIGEDDNERYLVLRWTPEGSKKPRINAVPLRDIGEREGWSQLRAGGLSVTAKSGLRAILADHLQRSGEREMWTIASATGWQCGAYIMPDGEVIGTPDRPVLFNGRSATARGYGTSGTPESWRDSVALLAGGNHSMMLGIACAFAAPLVGLVGAEGFGVHLFGGSSTGKTTTENIASSVYGKPEALKLTWYSTTLGLINEAAAHNDGFMPLDEIGQGSNRKAVAESAYALFNGVGKIQGAKEGGNRDIKRWRAMAFSTGEIDLESYIKMEGGKVNAGQLIRLLNVPITKAAEFHSHTDGRSHADALRDASNAHYGAVGRAWIKHLASQKREAVTAYREAQRRWLSLLPDGAGEQVTRVAGRFAVLETALLLSGRFTGWSEQESRDALQHSFTAWICEFGTGNKEDEQIIEQAEAFLSAHGMSRFAPLDYDPQSLPVHNLAGYRESKNYGEPVTFYVLPTPFKQEMAKGFNPVQFARTLHSAGMLKKPAKGRSYQGFTPRLRHLGDIKQRVYLLIPVSAVEE